MESKENVDSIVTNLVEAASKLIEHWTQKEAGDMMYWLKFLESLVKLIQDKYGKKLTGIDKAEYASKVIVDISTKLWNKYTGQLNEEETEKLKNNELKILYIIMKNPEILKASTSIFKKILNYIDKDKDGEISNEELKDFFCCCIPKK